MIKNCTSVDQAGWLRLRQSLWPHCTREEHLSEMASFCAAAPKRYAQFIAYSASGAVIGLIEAAVRSDYVNGTQFSPVMFLEGLYVIPEARRNGVARKLVEEVERWVRKAVVEKSHPTLQARITLATLCIARSDLRKPSGWCFFENRSGKNDLQVR